MIKENKKIAEQKFKYSIPNAEFIDFYYIDIILTSDCNDFECITIHNNGKLGM